ncbi:hypothetical protein ACQKM1_22230 [Peribacillus frigoritolerans]|uniref:hypothetical protein n=1 Tax=Peribacillus frigoritolerans TaxID=450367 RepID=UPI003CFC977C
MPIPTNEALAEQNKHQQYQMNDIKDDVKDIKDVLRNYDERMRKTEDSALLSKETMVGFKEAITEMKSFFQNLNTKLDKQNEDMNTKIDEQNKNMNTKIDEQNQKIDVFITQKEIEKSKGTGAFKVALVNAGASIIVSICAVVGAIWSGFLKLP